MTIVNYDTPSFCAYTAFHTHTSVITQACYRYIPTFIISIKPLANLRFVVKVLKNPCTLLGMK